MEKLKLYKIFGIIISILSVLSVGSAIYFVYLLHKIETFYRIMGCVLLVLFLITLVYSIIESIKSRKKAKFFVSLVFSILLIALSLGVSVVISSVYSKLQRMSNTSEEVIYTTVLIALEDKGKVEELSNLKIGIVDNEEDYTQYTLPLEVIEQYKLDEKNEISKISDSITLMNMLLNKELDAIFISSSYKEMFKKVEGYTDEVKFSEITTYSKKYEKKVVMSDEEEIDASEITKPFTVLLLGVDSDDEIMDPNASFNGDTIMVLAIDPITLHVTMFSIPRDTYVPMGCGGNITKINAATWGGTYCMVKTVEKLTGINMDYYVNINFKGVVDLVDALGGVTIDVPMNFCETDSHRWGGYYEICLNKGVQHLNGEQALAVARHRKSLPTGDFQRGQNQQVVVEGMLNSAKNIKSVTDFYKVLDTVSKNIETNMSTNEMLSLYKFMKDILVKSGDIKPNITKTFLTGYSLMDWTGYYYTYTFQYYRHSLNAIVNALKVNLGLASKPEIKSISFSINSPYQRAVVGEDYTREPYKSTMPDLMGMRSNEAIAKAQSLGLVVETKVVDVPCEDWYYDDVIWTQSIHEGVLLERVSNKILLEISHKDDAKCALENKPGTDTSTSASTDNAADNSSTDSGTDNNTPTDNQGEGGGTPDPNNSEDNND